MKVAVTILTFCVACLLALGLVMLYSASIVMVDTHTHAEVGAHMLKMQCLWCLLGLAACATVTMVDYAWLKKHAILIFVASLVLAGLVFVPHIGKHLNGARRWIRLPGATLQPSEVVKIATILLLAWYGEISKRRMHEFWRGMVIPGLLLATAVAPIFVEPDRGTTVLLAMVGVTMMVLAGVRWAYLIPAVVLAGAGLAYSLKHDSMRSGRIDAWLHPSAHLSNSALQAEQAKIAMGSGGWTGLGLGDGRQKLGFLPEIHSDFIFANIGEELGLVATLLVLLAFLLVALSGLYISFRARDRFGSLAAAGVTTLISCQAIFNMCVVTSLVPNKGLSLPFISEGGSNLVAMLLGVGIILNIARQGAASSAISASDVTPAEFPANPFAARAT